MTTRMWIVRCGNGRQYEAFKAKQVVAIGWVFFRTGGVSPPAALKRCYGGMS